MGSITKVEEEKIVEFRKRLSDLDFSSNELLLDMQLIRWLRARDMSLDKAEELLRNHLAWRRDNEIDTILSKQVPESWRAEFPFEIVGHDKEGNPVVVIPYGKMDLKRGLREKGKEESKTMSHYYMEEVYQAALKKSDGKVMKRFSMILDVEGLAYSQFASVEVLEYCFSSLQTFEQQYPETLATAFVLNAPTVWSVLWSMGKVFLHQRTQDKVRIVGSDFSKAKDLLMQYIDEDHIPIKYGGKAIQKYPEPVRVVDVNENKTERYGSGSGNTSSFFSLFKR